MSEKTIDYYLNLPYTIEFKQDTSTSNETVWYAAVRELPGCMTEADTFEEAAHMIRDALQVWIGGSLEVGLPIPEPEPEPEYSGKFSLRVPKSLHRALVKAAEREGVSLNQFVNTTLSYAIGQRQHNGR